MATRTARRSRMASPRKKTRRAGPSPWLWLGSGLALGLLVTLLVFLASHDPEQRTASEAQSKQSEPPGRDAADPGTTDSSGKSRFDFYSRLPRQQVEIPAEELRPSRKQTQQGPWVLQVGSFRSFRDADRVRATLALQGIESRIDFSENKSGIWHRVRIGPMASRREADKLRSRLAKQNLQSLILEQKAN